METNKILKANVLDIIFDGRNKSYGAYELRKTYNNRLIIALITTISICLLIYGIYEIYKQFATKKTQHVEVRDVKLEEIKTDVPKPPDIPPPPPPKMPEPPKIEMAKFTPPKIVKDEEVKKEDQPPPVEKLENTRIGAVNQEGKKDDGSVPPTEVLSAGTGPVQPSEDYNKVFTKVENPAEFPGGQSEWRRYLGKTLNAEEAIEAGAAPGSYTVKVQFIVDKEGNISDVQSLNDPGFGMAAQAVNVIKKGPKWKPALQNGRNVIFQMVQGITFQIQGE